MSPYTYIGLEYNNQQQQKKQDAIIHAGMFQAVHELVQKRKRDKEAVVMSRDPTFILEAVERVTGTSIESMMERCRKRDIVRARQLSMYIIRQVYGERFSLNSIGAIFGGFDYTTVIHSMNAIENEIATNEGVRQMYQQIKRIINQ